MEEKFLGDSSEISTHQRKIEEFKKLKNKEEFIRVNENVDLLREAMKHRTVRKLIMSSTNFRGSLMKLWPGSPNKDPIEKRRMI